MVLSFWWRPVCEYSRFAAEVGWVSAASALVSWEAKYPAPPGDIRQGEPRGPGRIQIQDIHRTSAYCLGSISFSSGSGIKAYSFIKQIKDVQTKIFFFRIFYCRNLMNHSVIKKFLKIITWGFGWYSAPGSGSVDPYMFTDPNPRSQNVADPDHNPKH